MQRVPLAEHQQDRVAASLPFVESLARRMASTMPHSIDLGDLVQDGVLGLIDAAHRFDEGRGIKFETFAERRVRGAMIDALRRDAWPRGVRRVRRELEAAREQLRRELGAEPSLADLAARVGADVRASSGRSSASARSNPRRRWRTSKRSTARRCRPSWCRASRCRRIACSNRREMRDRVRTALAQLPERERRIITLYYFDEATMKQIGAAIGVNESRVSQLHARAIQRLEEGARREHALPAAPRLVAKTKRPRIRLPDARRSARRRRRRHGASEAPRFGARFRRFRGSTVERSELRNSRSPGTVKREAVVILGRGAPPAARARADKIRRGVSPNPRFPSPPARDREAGTASGSSGIRSLRETVRRRCRRRRRSRRSAGARCAACCAETSRKNVMPSTFGIFRSQMITS